MKTMCLREILKTRTSEMLYIFFFMFIFDVSFNIGIYKILPPASCSATLYPESPLIVWFTLNRIFPHSSTPYLFRKTEQHIHFTFHVYFDVIAFQAQATPSAMATYNYSYQTI